MKLSCGRLDHLEIAEHALRAMNQDAKRLVANPTVVTQATDDGAVLVEMNSGDCFELNRSGAEIWARITAGDPVAAIVASVAERYAIPESVADSDARQLIADLIRRGLLTPAQP
jgi:hypothetical protein